MTNTKLPPANTFNEIRTAGLSHELHVLCTWSNGTHHALRLNGKVQQVGVLSEAPIATLKNLTLGSRWVPGDVPDAVLHSALNRSARPLVIIHDCFAFLCAIVQRSSCVCILQSHSEYTSYPYSPVFGNPVLEDGLDGNVGEVRCALFCERCLFDIFFFFVIVLSF